MKPTLAFLTERLLATLASLNVEQAHETGDLAHPAVMQRERTVESERKQFLANLKLFLTNPLCDLVLAQGGLGPGAKIRTLFSNAIA
jgi:hypothetical protein